MAFIYSGRCISRTRLEGKTAIITGCNTGLGKVNALDFFERGCRVIMACRNLDKAEEAARNIKAKSRNVNPGQLIVKQLDLSSFSSVREFAQHIIEEEQYLHILVNNAGVMMCPQTLTEDGYELQMQVNHLSHFLLTLLLLPKIRASGPARIVNVSSVGHKYGINDFNDLKLENTRYDSLRAYGLSKLANVHFTTELAKRLKGTDVTVYAVHPGYVRTDLSRHFDSIYFPGFRILLRILFGWLTKNPEQGAQTQIHCAVDDEAGIQTGLYYADCRPVEPYVVAKDAAAAAELWKISEKCVNFSDVHK